MFKFDSKYFLGAVVLFIAEVFIAAFMHDNFIRPTFGDFLVVILMYCALGTFIKADYRIIAIAVLLIAYSLEISQYFHLIGHLGLKYSILAKCILGSGFSWGDMLAYTLGVTSIWIIESRRKNIAQGQALYS